GDGREVKGVRGKGRGDLREGVNMKNFDSRTYSINDFLEWEDKKQLELSPKFQRRSVWTDTARSYLMDTIVRGKPIPKIFIRQKINPQTRVSIREVVDGQQRLRTILSYLRDGFQISNKEQEANRQLLFHIRKGFPSRPRPNWNGTFARQSKRFGEYLVIACAIRNFIASTS